MPCNPPPIRSSKCSFQPSAILAISTCGARCPQPSVAWSARSSSSTASGRRCSALAKASTRPHPHIGLATLTYLIDGEIDHRDGEGYVQTIRPGEVNLMTAGRGIVHSERSGAEFRAREDRLFGFQTWLALPLELEETDPRFQHVAASELPRLTGEGAEVRLLAGTFGGARAPTRIFSDTLYAGVALIDGARFRIDGEHVERALYVVDGEIEVKGQTGCFSKDQLVVLRPGAEIVVMAHGPARLMMLGGEPLPEKRHIFWNFVSSRRERIDQAAEEWQSGRFVRKRDDDVRVLHGAVLTGRSATREWCRPYGRSKQHRC